MKNDNCIYSNTQAGSVNGLAIKPYKIKRLAFVNNRQFWSHWNEPGSYFSSVYSLATCMCLARFRDDECRQMLIGWHNKHEFRIDYAGISSIIKDAKDFTRETVQERKRQENFRYRAKQKEMKALNVGEVSSK